MQNARKGVDECVGRVIRDQIFLSLVFLSSFWSHLPIFFGDSIVSSFVSR